MNFSDIFKSSFLENATAISLFDMLVALLLAFSIGLFIFFVYKKSYSGLMYSASFGTTLIALTMITTLVILAVTVGGAYFGILGMFLGVPIVAVIKMILEDYMEQKAKNKEKIEENQI